MLHVGDSAPAFTAPDQSGKIHSLQEYAGRFVLLYFYPKDDTPGCTTEACGFRDHFDELSKKAVILGVSKDDAESHARFAEKYDLPFPLLADPDKAIIAAYGADGVIYPKRVSFLIAPDGTIKKIYDKVACEEHAEEVLRDIATFV
ncbi:peroxiredoxin [Candidatus Peribacteria bacterium RIFCSPHIGHO2_01_FULL_55_13]|nr:MAG: peroxiredoxin [Candidatus Peribacteria bacterium RIFCSPHIGHO2_01_FULL_55_13]OGJ65385.1 MAG: peroxiredoxin [Candidatus Peribacteria bacterium RIFCSPHIGHO2_12_FULL_55_11]